MIESARIDEFAPTLLTLSNFSQFLVSITFFDHVNVILETILFEPIIKPQFLSTTKTFSGTLIPMQVPATICSFSHPAWFLGMEKCVMKVITLGRWKLIVALFAFFYQVKFLVSFALLDDMHKIFE